MLKFKEITRENEIQKLVETSVGSSWSLQKLLGLGLGFLKKEKKEPLILVLRNIKKKIKTCWF